MILNASPLTGPLTGLNTVTVLLEDNVAATAIDFGQTAGTNFSCVQLPNTDQWVATATAPAGTGTVNLTVVSAGGASSAGAYVYVPPPNATSLSPSAGPLGGGTLVTITGVNLGNDATPPQVEFGSTSVPPAGVTVNLNGTVTAYSPAHAAGTVPVSLTTVGGTVVAGNFTYTAAPIVSGVSPNFGPYEGGTLVTVSGSGFTNATAVSFGGVPASSFFVLSDGSLDAVSPPGALGNTDITVTTAGGPSATSVKDKFTYEAIAPEIDSMGPATGPATGGTNVIITGKYFLGTTAVDFGSTPATSFHVDSSTQLEAVSPAGVAGTVPVRVFTPGEESIISYPDQFTYTAVSSVTGVSPAFGSVAGGTTVTITGTGFTGATVVDFGGVAGTIFPGLHSDTQIIATSPPGAPGNVDVTVVTANGSTPTSPADIFTYQVPAPVVSSLRRRCGFSERRHVGYDQRREFVVCDCGEFRQQSRDPVGS